MSNSVDCHNKSSSAEFSALKALNLDYTEYYPTAVHPDMFEKELKEPAQLSLSYSPYAVYLSPIVVYSYSIVEFVQSKSKKDYIFTPPPGYDLLRSSCHEFKVPAIEVKKESVGEYQIRWPDDLSHHIVPCEKMKLGDTLLCEKMAIGNVLMGQFNIDFNHKASIDRDHGNIPALTEWTTKLQRHTLRRDNKWYYSQNRGWEFPLYKLNSQIRLSHVSTLKLRINELLRMRRRVNGVWVPIVPDMNQITVINNKTDEPVHSIKSVRMFGELVKLTFDEKKLFHDKNNKYVFENMVITKTPFNKTDCGQEIKSRIGHAGGIVRASYWGALNETAYKLNDMSNFTTNHRDSSKGYNLCKKTEVKHGKSVKIGTIGSNMFNGPHAREHFKSTTGKVGVHALSFCESVHEGDLMGINAGMLKTSIINHIINQKYIDKEDADNNYTMYMCSQTIKHIKFDADGNFKILSIADSNI